MKSETETPENSNIYIRLLNNKLQEKVVDPLRHQYYFLRKFGKNQ